ncbi:MAG: SDR family NAD(P)-dependent oxidoreductase, partial [Proteobacteria bacterium]|nr:SDR family NAD(P)-dependent oxidoreductase [Pseudomonadota bacterium]
MELKGKVVAVTGGASGIGKALCQRFKAEGAEAIAVIDLNEDDAQAVAAEVGGTAYGIDVSDENQVAAVVSDIESRCWRIDLWVSNAGIGRAEPGHVASGPNEDWEACWKINLMAHVYAVRAALPAMLVRGEGYFLHTASAAGLLSQIGNASYSVTKAGAVAFAESVAITHGDDGIKVS